MTFLMRELPQPADFLGANVGDLYHSNLDAPLLQILSRVDLPTALKNRFAPAVPMTAIGAPTFTTDSGSFSGNGATPKGIDTGIIVSGPIFMLALFNKPSSVCSVISGGTGTSLIGIEATTTTVLMKNSTGAAPASAAIPWPSDLGGSRIFVAGWGVPGDFAHLAVFGAGEVLDTADGTTAGAKRATTGTLQIARTGGGSGNFQGQYFAAFGRAGQYQDMLDEALYTYLEMRARFPGTVY